MKWMVAPAGSVTAWAIGKSEFGILWRTMSWAAAGGGGRNSAAAQDGGQAVKALEGFMDPLSGGWMVSACCRSGRARPGPRRGVARCGRDLAPDSGAAPLPQLLRT
jgi:hypothetical protein